MQANAALIAEAGNVFHETGLTPRQLVEQRDALAEALEKFASIAVNCQKEIVPNGYANPEDWRRDVEQARAALALVKGATP